MVLGFNLQFSNESLLSTEWKQLDKALGRKIEPYLIGFST